MNRYRQVFNAAGYRRTELVIEQIVDAAANTAGEVLPEVDRVICRRMAAKSTELGREYQAAMTTQSVLNSVYEVPYDDVTCTLTPRMRVRIGTRTLNIASVVDFEDRHEKIVLGLTESVSD